MPASNRRGCEAWFQQHVGSPAVRHRRSFLATVIRSRLIWIGAPLLIGGAICLAVALRLFWIEWQYHSSAQKTQGIVVTKWRSANPSGSFGGTAGSRGAGSATGGVNYTVHYRYQTDSGGDQEGEDDVSRDFWEKLRPGDSLRVFYLPKSPAHSRLWMGIRTFLPLVLFILGTTMLVMGLVAEILVVGDLRKKYIKKRS